MSFATKYGPWAVVTGASRGLGAEFARQAAGLGVNVVLVARSGEELRVRADELERATGVQTRVVALDLGDEAFLPVLAEATDELEIGLLVNNAGVSTVGPFLGQDPEFLVHQVRVNVAAGVALARHFGARMVERGRGGIIFLSSGSALHGTPWSANYSGTKAHNAMLAEALWYELAPHGVDVLGFMAGATRTPGWQANHPGRSRIVPVMDPEPAVAQALHALGRRPSVAAGRRNRLGYAAMGLAPRAVAVRMLGRSMGRMFGPFPPLDAASGLSEQEKEQESS